MAWIGKTVLVMARTINAPPAENIAFATAAAKLPATMAMNAVSITAYSLRIQRWR